MKKLCCLLLVCVILGTLIGCGPKPGGEKDGVSTAFKIESLCVKTEYESLAAYAKTALKDAKVTYSDEASLVISLKEDPKMPEKDYTFRVDSVSSVTVRGGSKGAMRNALGAFLELYVLTDNSRVNVGVSMAYEDYSAATADSGIPGWTLKWCSRRLLADGVTYEERLYNDKSGAPHKAYIVFADPKTTTIHYGTSQDSYTDAPTIKQDVLQQVQASAANGYNVAAAVNADFFNISGDYHPIGLAIKNGKKLNTRSVSGKPYLAVTKDGQYMIRPLYLPTDDTSNVLNAISGNYAIVTNGEPFMTAMDTTHGTTQHPRTLSGVTAEGGLILAVIDGRQSSLSNGADLESAAYFMISLGAERAVNHDGGGSSTMVLRTLGNSRVMNSPSDGSLRKVFGSIQVVLKEK